MKLEGERTLPEILWYCMLLPKVTPYNLPAAIVKIKTNGDLCALSDRPQ